MNTTATADQSSRKPAPKGMFTLPDGRNVLFTFCLVSSLFLLWGFCNGMIDVMDKHFQEELHLTLSQSAWVQFAHWMGYFLMSLPAGWLATRLGYKGGIIAGLLLVAVGGFWFVPATGIAAFWAFLLGVCVVACGLTFLETVANPYTTVLGTPRYSATRINLAQSCNGVGWVLGPIAGMLFFYNKDAAGKSTGAATLWVPYAGVAVVVLILAAIFFFAPVPDVKAEDDYQLDSNGDDADTKAAPVVREVNRALSYALLLGNVSVVIGVFGMILWLALGSLGVGSHLIGFASALPHFGATPMTADAALLTTLGAAGCVAFVIAAIWLVGFTGRLSHRSVWAHEHFSGATLAQFLYVAAQSGIFSFLINYMTSEPPATPAAWVSAVDKIAAVFPAFMHNFFMGWFETDKAGILRFSNKLASGLASFGFLWFLAGRVVGALLLKRMSAHKGVGLYGLINVVVCLLIFMKLGWLSVVCVFLSYFFMSIMFPTIFALGIFGLGVRAKGASAFIVMGIVGGAMLPKVMGAIADHYNMSRGFIMPLICFGLIALYGYCWPKLSRAEALHGVGASSGH
ncbi:MAG TPA: MFS transporter [Candidatus Acidoferrum sp.]|nr:MFS transporter [Candidatus Acidoferrum sp.]